MVSALFMLRGNVSNRELLYNCILKEIFYRIVPADFGRCNAESSAAVVTNTVRLVLPSDYKNIALPTLVIAVLRNNNFQRARNL